MYQNTKSATTAGLLGIFLGAFGAHDWYLGEKGKGIAHVCMMSGGILLEILTIAILPNVLSWTMLIQMAWLFAILSPIALLAMSASGIWGLVEGIIILTQGDAGLARKGYAVVQPVMPMQGYGQPMNNGMNMNSNMGMNNGMNMGGNNMGMNDNMNNSMGMGGNNMMMNNNMNSGMNMNGNVGMNNGVNMNENSMNNSMGGSTSVSNNIDKTNQVNDGTSNKDANQNSEQK